MFSQFHFVRYNKAVKYFLLHKPFIFSYSSIIGLSKISVRLICKKKSFTEYHTLEMLHSVRLTWS